MSASSARPQNAGLLWRVLFLVTLLVIAGALGYLVGTEADGLKLASLPARATPFFSAHIQGRAPNGTLVDLGGASVSVFAIEPRSISGDLLTNLTDLATANNPYYVQLANGTAGATGWFYASQSPLWRTVSIEWASIASPLSVNTSIRLDATYGFPTGGSVEFFHASENVPVSIWSPPSAINSTLVLNLTAPFAFGPGAGPPGSQGVPTNPRTTSCGFSMNTSWTNGEYAVLRGQFPMAWVADLIETPGGSASVSDAWLAFSSLSMSVPSVQVFGSQPPVSSSNPSWTGTLPGFGSTGSAAGALPDNSSDLGVVTLDNTTLVSIAQVEAVHWSDGVCGNGTVLTPVLTLSLADAFQNSDLSVCSGGGCTTSWLLSNSWNRAVIQLMTGLPGATLIASFNRTTGYGVLWPNHLPADSGLNQSTAAEARAHGTPFGFLVNLGEGLAFLDLASSCYGTCGQNCTPCADAILSQQLGSAYSKIRELASIGYAIPVGPIAANSVAQLIGFDYSSGVRGSWVNWEMEGSVLSTTLLIGGTPWSYRAADSGMFACPVGSAPTPGSVC